MTTKDLREKACVVLAEALADPKKHEAQIQQLAIQILHVPIQNDSEDGPQETKAND